MNKRQTKCKLKGCLNYEGGSCYLNDLPPARTELKYNSTKCPYYSVSFEDDMKWLKQHGGILNLILKGRNKRTEDELKAIKKAKRKKRKTK